MRWKLPGGKSKGGESPDVALHREILEELGIVVSIKKEVCRKQEEGGHIFVVYETEYYNGNIYLRDVQNIIPCSRRRIGHMLASGLILPNHAEALTIAGL